jgi:hypothetical protein
VVEVYKYDEIECKDCQYSREIQSLWGDDVDENKERKLYLCCCRFPPVSNTRSGVSVFPRAYAKCGEYKKKEN